MWVIFVVIHEIWKKGNIFSDVTTSQQKNSYFVNSNKFWNVGFSSEKSVLDWLAKITWNIQDYFDAVQIYLELKSKKILFVFKRYFETFQPIWSFPKLLVIKVKNENAYSEIISAPMYLLLNERIPHTLTSSSVAQELASECPYLKVSIFFLSEEWY